MSGTITETRALKESEPTNWSGAKLAPSLGLITAASFFWFMSPPEGLTPQAWHLLVIFLTTIFAVILKPLPMGAISIIATTVCIASNTLTLDQALSSFSSNVVWLIVLAFFLALGFKVTGLGTRLAYFFISLLGKSTLGLSYGFVLTELFLSPFVPSNTARGAGIVFPVVSSLALEEGSDPKQGTQNKMGAFLLSVAFHANVITAAMFLTALVGNPLIASLASTAGVEITWTSWALAACVPGLVSLIIMPLVLYKLCPPTLKSSPDAQNQARQRLKELGALSLNEKLMLVSFLGVLVLWIVGGEYGIEPTTAALIGFGILLFSGVLKWKDCINETGAWETLMWFAPLLMMATFLTKFGMMAWFSTHVQGVVSTLSWPVALLAVCLVYYYIHYVFASVTARITALYSAFLLVLLGAGTPPMVAAMSLAVLSSLSGGLTHFGTGTAPVYFGAGYVPVADWWRNSFIISVVNLGIWAIVGGLWWNVLGYW